MDEQLINLLTTTPDDHRLICSCGSYHTHQYKTESFVRLEEDGKGVKTTIIGLCGDGLPKVDISSAEDERLGRRRDSIFITMSCEDCDSDTILEIYQHKGSTFLKLNYTGTGWLFRFWFWFWYLTDVGKPRNILIVVFFYQRDPSNHTKREKKELIL